MKRFKLVDARKIGNKLGVDWSKIDVRELVVGMNAEREHARTLGGTSAKLMAKIALDHLDEDPKYYTHLIAMEKKVC